MPISSPSSPPNPTRTAIGFVDVGFLLRAAGEALGLDPVAAKERFDPEQLVMILSMAAGRERGTELIRAYAYDGELDGTHPERPTQEPWFEKLANAPGLRLRLGHLVERQAGTSKARFEQKGVDTLLVIDLMSGALKGTFDTAVVVAGDRDFAEAVRVVQDDLGRRVNLLYPAGARVARSLLQVADLYAEIGIPHLRMMFPEESPPSAG